MFRLDRVLASFCLSSGLSISCGSAPAAYGIDEYLKPVSFQAQIGVELAATAGQTIFVEGSLQLLVPALELSDRIDSTMPGAYSLPFDFYIEKTTLLLIYQTDSHLYYDAPPEDCGASHSVLGNVLATGDLVGVRVAKESNGKYEWFVDNSVYNRMRTVWSREVTPDERISLIATTAVRDSKNPEGTLLLFHGYYGGQVHFQLIRQHHEASDVQELHFDMEPSGTPTVIAIQGLVLEVLSAGNLGIKYRWIRLGF